jgi:hypothetical protein
MTRARSRRRDAGVESPISDLAETSTVGTTFDAVAHRAYELFFARGGEHGHDVDDWRQAEQEVRNTSTLS